MTPRDAAVGVEVWDGPIRSRVTAPPEDGRATEAARRLLAQALGVAPSRLKLLRGSAARDKLFALDRGPPDGGCWRKR